MSPQAEKYHPLDCPSAIGALSFIANKGGYDEDN